MSRRIRCYDFTRDHCCSSCHYDEEEGYDSMMEAMDINGSEVCCGVANWIDEHPDAARAIVADLAPALPNGEGT